MTDALHQLSGLLRDSLHLGGGSMPHSFESIEGISRELRRRGACGVEEPPDDVIHAAVSRFWDSPKLTSLRDGRYVTFGMCVPHKAGGASIMEDRHHFLAVLDSSTGVGQWADSPRRYRRCYQGLLRSYFEYDTHVEDAPRVGRQNWGDLRDYLNENVGKIVDSRTNPDWVHTARENSSILGEEPCRAYAEEVLAGDKERLDELCEHLGIQQSSWFLRELILAQVRYAATLDHAEFASYLPALLRALRALEGNRVVRDRGLITLLDKYSDHPNPMLHIELRDVAVGWWGNPWLPSNETRWGGVSRVAREMVGDWLKREFIEAFFAKLAGDHIGDRRRANFWLRYVKSMGEIRFALGSQALHSRQPDFVALRKKMHGLFTTLEGTVADNNAFIMTLGSLVAVEFGAQGNAFYGYDSRRNLPFDTAKPLYLTVDGRNSLKNSDRLIKLRHQDDILGFSRWEEMFAHNLKHHFGIEPDSV